MLLRALIRDLPGLPVGEPSPDLEVEVTSIDLDSRAVRPGSLFCCIRGAHTDGHEHARAAVEQGAVAVLADHRLDLAVPCLVVPDTRPAMAHLAVRFNGDPASSMTVLGVSGTNGKTTTTYLLRAIFEAAGRTTEVVGTLSGARTTPEAPELQARLAGMRDRGVEVVAMEVSSHALSMHRVDGTRFAAVVFTNLSRDHLDFHETMESYFEAKARLFEPEFANRAVVNLDSPYGRLLLDAAKIPTTGYSLDDVSDLVVDADGSRFTWRGHPVEFGLGGRFNVSNALAAAEAAVAVGLDPAVVAAGLSQPIVVPGRFELVDAGQPFRVVIDYAHTPDGLEQLLTAVRDVTGDGAVTVVFGCGGERDATKRPAMGEVAATLADRVVLTADNSRGEETGAIIDAVSTGYDRTTDRRAAELLIEPDRRRAIAVALAAARPGDTVVIAGKGHETTQTIGDTVVPFDDREVTRVELGRLTGPGAGGNDGA
ncbi:MAG: UDP-N-acetylmuramoyl-L-alanyl-D-glutamate--2,6-diaminopimelate ligase [Acidimicrobiales bacterium]